jgi:heme/copper-type cytochrome/quinol oxidase subunit 2
MKRSTRISEKFSAGVAIAALAVFISGVRAADDMVNITITREGFRPDIVHAHRGEILRLRVTTGDDEHCFALDAFRIEKRVRPSRPVLVELTPDRAGTFEMYCCLEPRDEAPRGRLIVGD